jgi:serine/threonine-protein kinase
MVMDWGVAKVVRSVEVAPLGPPPQPPERPEPPAAGGARTEDGALTAAGTVMGTPGFMAPEQARGEVESLDERADVYSLGAVLAVMVEASGVSPTATTLTLPGAGSAGDASARRAPRVPKRLGAIVAKARAVRPADRYCGALELAADVERFLDGGSVSALPERVWTRTGRFLSNHRVAVVLILVYVIVRTLVLLFAGR